MFLVSSQLQFSGDLALLGIPDHPDAAGSWVLLPLFLLTGPGSMVFQVRHGQSCTATQKFPSAGIFVAQPSVHLWFETAEEGCLVNRGQSVQACKIQQVGCYSSSWWNSSADCVGVATAGCAAARLQSAHAAGNGQPIRCRQIHCGSAQQQCCAGPPPDSAKVRNWLFRQLQ